MKKILTAIFISLAIASCSKEEVGISCQYQVTYDQPSYKAHLIFEYNSDGEIIAHQKITRSGQIFNSDPMTLYIEAPNGRVYYLLVGKVIKVHLGH